MAEADQSGIHTKGPPESQDECADALWRLLRGGGLSHGRWPRQGQQCGQAAAQGRRRLRASAPALCATPHRNPSPIASSFEHSLHRARLRLGESGGGPRSPRSPTHARRTVGIRMALPATGGQCGTVESTLLTPIPYYQNLLLSVARGIHPAFSYRVRTCAHTESIAVVGGVAAYIYNT